MIDNIQIMPSNRVHKPRKLKASSETSTPVDVVEAWLDEHPHKRDRTPIFDAGKYDAGKKK